MTPRTKFSIMMFLEFFIWGAWFELNFGYLPSLGFNASWQQPLILGAFTGVAAFFGGFLNWNFLMAGSASTNGLLFAIATLLVLAWKTAGWIGVDRWLLKALGTPWRPGYVFKREEQEPPTEIRRVA